jgi:hypothetical protein
MDNGRTRRVEILIDIDCYKLANKFNPGDNGVTKVITCLNLTDFDNLGINSLLIRLYGSY